MATAALFALTIVASFIYYRRIKQAQGEYEGAKDIIKNITLGFSKQINGLNRAITKIDNRTEDSGRASKEALETSADALNIASESLKASKDLSTRLEEAENTVNTMKSEIQKISKSTRAVTDRMPAEGPIPLQQESVLERLTDTEVEVLSIIDELAEASVPEIRERIKKTREHTARLLKKLYETGFIDRITGGMPYKYHIRKEIKEAVQQYKRGTQAIA